MVNTEIVAQESSNPFPMNQVISSSAKSNATVVESTRAQAEAQGAIIAAKKFPRDQTAAYNRIMQSCKRVKLAEASRYKYPKGGQVVTGPSIRLAEVLAQAWGNLKFGIRELSQENGVSEMQAYCWDLETNVQSEKIFTVKHERHTRQGVKKLDDPRDVYEMTANMGMRRVRATILAIIPPDVVEAALEACGKTMSGSGDGPLIDRVRKMVATFSDKFSVTQEIIEKRLGHKIDTTSESELLDLIDIHNSLRDGIATREEFFQLDQATVGVAADLNEKFAKPNKSDTKPVENKPKK